MKKSCRVLVAFFIIIFCVVIFFGCNKKSKYQEYFNNFSSSSAFSSAKLSLSLAENISIFSYDSNNDIFVTKMEVRNEYGETQGETMVLLGFASSQQVYCAPKYTSVLKVKGDYAVVTKPTVGTDASGKNIMIYRVGVVKFRNNSNGDTKDLTDFSIEYNSNYDQFSFVGDYIVCPGIKEAIHSSLPFSTFYEYSQGALLEAFRVKCGVDYNFSINDGILSAVAGNHAYFFLLSSLQLNGYLELNEKDFYYAFPEDEAGEYADQITVDIFYLGNGWFSRTAKIKDEKQFVGYNMILQEIDAETQQAKTYFAHVRSDLYNVKTKTVTEKEWLIVESVANEYNKDYYIELVSYLENLSNSDGETGRYNYVLPYLNPALSIKNGYSIVYYYYLPYIDSDNYQAEISFCLMDRQANIIRIDQLLMPPVFVDDWAIQTSDPMYENYFGSCSIYNYKMQEKVLAGVEADKLTYITYTLHSGGVVASAINLQTKEVFYGAIGTNGRRILPFIYTELTPFFGDYCIGVVKEGSAYLTYKIDKNNNTVLLNDVVNVRQGVYVFESAGKLGLKNYQGNVLVEAIYDSLDVVEKVMQDNKFISSYVVASLDKQTKIFILE